MHMWATTMQPEKVLLGNMVTLTLTRTEGVSDEGLKTGLGLETGLETDF